MLLKKELLKKEVKSNLASKNVLGENKIFIINMSWIFICVLTLKTHYGKKKISTVCTVCETNILVSSALV